jgi:hypothetical protein
MGRTYSLLGLYELRILCESARSGIDRKIVAWGWRKRLQAVGALQMVKESGGKPVGYYAGIGEAEEVELDAALRSGKLFEFERRDPADPAFWLIGFEREQTNNRGKLVWVHTVAATKADIGDAMVDLMPRASTVTGVAMVNVTKAVNAVHKILDDLARDRELLHAARQPAGTVQ